MTTHRITLHLPTLTTWALTALTLVSLTAAATTHLDAAASIELVTAVACVALQAVDAVTGWRHPTRPWGLPAVTSLVGVMAQVAAIQAYGGSHTIIALTLILLVLFTHLEAAGRLADIRTHVLAGATSLAACASIAFHLAGHHTIAHALALPAVALLMGALTVTAARHTATTTRQMLPLIILPIHLLATQAAAWATTTDTPPRATILITCAWAMSITLMLLSAPQGTKDTTQTSVAEQPSPGQDPEDAGNE